MTVILISGPQASGKGTQAELLEKRLGFKHVSIGKILRDKTKKNDVLGRQIKELIDKGEFVPNEITNEIALEYINNNEKIILDGYPRNKEQAEFLSRESDIDLMIVLEIFESLTIQRISNRRECPSCGNVYNLITKPPKNNKTCDCGTNLVLRKDDTQEYIKKRLYSYHKRTEPVINIFKKRNKVVFFDGSKDIEEIYKDVLSILKKKELV